MVNFATLLASTSIFAFATAGPLRRNPEDVSARALVHLLPRQGTQFITGPCKADADCAAGCCGFNTGKCAGAIIALQRDGGCGFGDAQPNDDAAKAIGFTGGISSASNAPAATNNDNDDDTAAAAKPAPAQTAGSGKAAGTQFITGPCANDGECASGCCAFNTGKCAGNIIALQRDGGCGFGDAEPNDDAARASGFTGGITSKSNGAQSGAAPAPAASPAATNAGNNNNGNSNNGAATNTGSAGNFKAANGKLAQDENAEFADLTEDSDCTDGDNACIGDAFAKCANGKFVLMPCGATLVCKSLPLVNSAGTSITCTTEADAEARIQTALSS